MIVMTIVNMSIVQATGENGKESENLTLVHPQSLFRILMALCKRPSATPPPSPPPDANFLIECVIGFEIGLFRRSQTLPLAS